MKVIIVGNGTSILNNKNEKLIDAHDIVIRLGGYVIKGYEEFAGIKTEVRICVAVVPVDVKVLKLFAYIEEYCGIFKVLPVNVAAPLLPVVVSVMLSCLVLLAVSTYVLIAFCDGTSKSLSAASVGSTSIGTPFVVPCAIIIYLFLPSPLMQEYHHLHYQ